MAECFQNTATHESPTAKQLLAHYFGSLKQGLNRCFAPTGDCRNRAIRSHSIQNSRVLDLLSRDGHVKMIVQKAEKNSLTIDFGDVGRNEASTFSGFCSEHDSSIFSPIDNCRFDSNSAEQLFLLAYRSVTRELHACMAGAIKLQQGYQKRIELGLDTGEVPEPAGEMALERMMYAYQTHVYKAALDESLLQTDYSKLAHTVFSVGHSSPCFAVSGFFDLFAMNDYRERSRIAVNVLPISASETIAAFSYTTADSFHAKNYLRELAEATGEYQKYLLSKLVLMHCENFVVAPSVFESWSTQRVDTICKFFVDTLRFDKEVDDPNLYLF
jgi:hypothetical protein